MSAEKEEGKAPIIIKKVKKGGHGGHHGGAWKVAYADFVTAMMAFFLLLWLLSTTTPEVRKGIAEYFTPTVGLKDAKGIGFEGGLTPNEQGASRSNLSNPGIVSGQVAQGPIPKPPSPVKEIPNVEEVDTGNPLPQQEDVPDDGRNASQKANQEQNKDEEQFKKLQESLLNAFEQTPELRQLKNNIVISNTPEGLKIDVVEDEKHILFAPGTADLTDTARTMLKAVSGIILRSRNHISITAHTEQLHYPPDATYTHWELTTDRANAARRYVVQSVLEPERVAKVVGMADRELLLPKEPSSPRNRRITLMLLRDSHMVGGKESAPPVKGLITVRKVDSKDAVTPPAPPPEPPKPKVVEAPPPEIGSNAIPESTPAPEVPDTVSSPKVDSKQAILPPLPPEPEKKETPEPSEPEEPVAPEIGSSSMPLSGPAPGAHDAITAPRIGKEAITAPVEAPKEEAPPEPEQAPEIGSSSIPTVGPAPDGAGMR